MDARFVHVVKIGQYFMTKDIEYTFSKHFLQEVTDHHNQNDGFRETRELDPCWKSRPIFSTVNMELKSDSGL